VKPILDVCCGPKSFYFNKKDPRVLFCDKRVFAGCTGKGQNRRTRRVDPDMVCDFTALPFKDNRFQMVVFDPPHLLGESGFHMKIMYGFLTDDWREVLGQGFSECFSVLKPGGFLIFKWNETHIKVSEVLRLTPETPLFGNRCGRLNKTHWICFMKGQGDCHR
jgi:SAM-dependent methyltransferase